MTSVKTFSTQELSFQEKVRMLPEKEQRYLQGYVDRAVQAFMANAQIHKSQKTNLHN